MCRFAPWLSPMYYGTYQPFGIFNTPVHITSFLESQVAGENLFKIDKYLSGYFGVCQICLD